MTFKWIDAFIGGFLVLSVMPVRGQIDMTTQTTAAENMTTSMVAGGGVSTGTGTIDSPASQTKVIETTAVQEIRETSVTVTSSNAEATSVSLPEGIIYQVLREGAGAATSNTQTMRLHYTLFLASGKRVESSRDVEIPKPLSLKLGQGDFIKGFELGVEGMKLGEIRRIFIPSELAYGETGQGAVPPNTNLIFEVELVDVK